jgi:MoxR-like ATPase
MPEDVKAVAVPVLAHRLLLTPEAETQGYTGARLVEQVLDATAVPTA